MGAACAGQGEGWAAMSFVRFAPYTESHERDGRHRIERRDTSWDVFINWRHVGTFSKRSDARDFIRAHKTEQRGRK